MKIAFIASYPPRECGIGTFTRNLYRSLTNNKGEGEPTNTGLVIAMNDTEEEYDYPEEVKFEIAQEQQGDCIEAAKFINISGADICVLQHEYGIYGGQNGVYILPLLHRLEIPLIVTLHTV